MNLIDDLFEDNIESFVDITEDTSKRSRYWELILYKDYDIRPYEDYLSFLESNFSVIYILHDRDVLSTGELKKEHFHIVFAFDNPISKSSFLNKVQYPFEHLCRNIPRFNDYLLYLIHYKDKNKFNYDLSDLRGDSVLIKKAYEQVKKSTYNESEDIVLIINYIINNNNYISQAEISNFVVNSDVWTTFRRNYSFILNLIREHNERQIRRRGE